MHRRIKFVRGLTFLFVLTLASHVLADTKIGFVDSQKILANFSEAVDALKKLETENDQWAKDLEKLTRDRDAKEKEIDEQSLLLSEARKQEKLKELENLETKIRQFQSAKWGDNGEYFSRREQLLKPIFDKINAAIAEVAQDEKFNFVFDTVNGNLLYGEEKYDITDMVLDILEEQIDLEE